MHSDPELLSLLALGEHAGTDAERLHAESCAVCAAEVAELQQVVTLARATLDDGPLIEPSPDVWARIQAELALDPSLAPSDVAAEPVTAAHGVRAWAQLNAVDEAWASASGTAELSTDAQGRRVLQVALHADLPTSGLRQAWLIHKDDPRQRQTLGILDGTHGLWTVDHSVDLEQYAILDISLQGLGETEHSGRSLVRGQLALIS